MAMLAVRAVREQDVNDLLMLAGLAGSEAEEFGRCVELACASFAGRIAIPQRDFLFVLEDAAAGRPVGFCRLRSTAGLDAPHYSYRIGTLVHSSNELGLMSPMGVLYLSNDLTDCAALCEPFLHPGYRHTAMAALLMKSGLMFVAQFPHLFPEKLIVPLRGFRRADGTSPFWESLGQHFFKADFAQAQSLAGSGKKPHIAELMPRHPLYADYLPQEAQETIGLAHEEAVPVRRLLEQENMHFEGHIDILDAGPILQARLSGLRILRESEPATIDDGHAERAGHALHLVTSTHMRDFRAITVPATLSHARIALSRQQQELLDCRAGDAVRAISLDPRKNLHA